METDRVTAGGLLRRRDFLAFSSAALLSPWLAGAAQAQELLTADAGVLPATLGYLEGSDLLVNLRRLPRAVRNPAAAVNVPEALGAIPEIVPAHTLPLGDTELVGRPLRLTIHGLYPGAALRGPARRRQLPLAVDLDVIFPPPDPIFPKPAPYFAWSFRRRPGWNPSPPVSFVFPLDWYVYPELRLRVVPAARGAAPATLRTRFTLDDESGLPRLRRGVYLIGLTPEAWRSGMALGELAGSAPAGRVSILLSIDSEPNAE
jgi:hypothetical protein